MLGWLGDNAQEGGGATTITTLSEVAAMASFDRDVEACGIGEGLGCGRFATAFFGHLFWGVALFCTASQNHSAKIFMFARWTSDLAKIWKHKKSVQETLYRVSLLGSIQHHKSFVQLDVPVRKELLYCIICWSPLCWYWGFSRSCSGTNLAPSRPSLSPKAGWKTKKLLFQLWMEEGRPVMNARPWWGSMNHQPLAFRYFLSMKKARNRDIWDRMSRRWQRTTKELGIWKELGAN